MKRSRKAESWMDSEDPSVVIFLLVVVIIAAIIMKISGQGFLG